MRQAVWLFVFAGLLGPISLLEAAPQSRDAPNPNATRRYADIPFQGDLEMSLKTRLAKIQDLQELIEKLQKYPELFDLKGLKKGNWKDPKFLQKEGPKLLKMFEKLGLVQKEGEGLKLNKEKLDALKKLKKSLEVGGGPNPLPEQNPGTPKSSVPLPFPESQPPRQPVTPPDPSTTGQGEEPDKLAEFFKDWMLKLEDSKLGEIFRNSPAFQEGLKDLAQAFQKGEGGSWKPGVFTDALTKWGGPGDLSWLKSNFSRFNDLSMPSLRPPRFFGRRFGKWAMNLPAPAAGTWVAPGAGGFGVGMVFLWVGVAVVVLILLWKFLPHLKLAARARQEQGWRPGSWPVDPRTVSTRAEVVRAFEFLSLLRFGLDVRTWNHRDIAVALGEGSEHRQAANELAQVYELARYTPDDERLPDASLAAARRDLCSLAGLS
jgi:hypothetical protein